MAERFHTQPDQLDRLTAREWHLLLAEAPGPVEAPPRIRPRTVAEFKAMQGGDG